MNFTDYTITLIARSIMNQDTNSFTTLRPRYHRYLEANRCSLLTRLTRPRHLDRLISKGHIVSGDTNRQRVQVINAVSSSSIDLANVQRGRLFRVFSTLHNSNNNQLRAAIFSRRNRPIRSNMKQLKRIRRRRPIHNRHMPVHRAIVRSHTHPFLNRLSTTHTVRSTTVVIIQLSRPMFEVLSSVQETVPRFSQYNLR